MCLFAQYNGMGADPEKKKYFLEKRSVKKLGNTFPGLNCCDEDGDAFICSGTFSLGYRSFRTGVRDVRLTETVRGIRPLVLQPLS